MIRCKLKIDMTISKPNEPDRIIKALGNTMYLYCNYDNDVFWKTDVYELDGWEIKREEQPP